MAEGAKVIARAIAAGHVPRSVLCAARFADSISALVPAGTPVLVRSEEELEAITGFDVHRGALAAMNRPDACRPWHRSSPTRGAWWCLRRLVEHTNVGAIFRSAAGLGADAVVVVPSCADPLYRRSVKVSMGAVFQVPWTRAEKWPDALDELRALGFVVAGLALTEGAVALDEFAAAGHERVALVHGHGRRRAHPGGARPRGRQRRHPHARGSGLAQRGRSVGRGDVGTAGHPLSVGRSTSMASVGGTGNRQFSVTLSPKCQNPVLLDRRRGVARRCGVACAKPGSRVSHPSAIIEHMFE